MENKFKRFLSLALILCMAVTTLFVPALAAESDGTEETTAPATAAEYVAMIGEVGYETMQAAVNAAVNGDEIDLVANVENQPVYVNKEITIDLNGHTYKQTAAKEYIAEFDGKKYYIYPYVESTDNKGMINVHGGALTVKDSVGTGMMESTVGSLFCLSRPLTIESGVYKVDTYQKTGNNASVIVSKNQYTYGVALNINGGAFYTNEGAMPFKLGLVAGNTTDAVTIGAAWFAESIQSGWIDAKNAKGFTYLEQAYNDGYLVTHGALTVDGAWYENWDVAKGSIKKNSEIVLYADAVNTYNGGTVAKDFKFLANGGTITLDLNGHTFTSATTDASKITTITVQYNTTLKISDSVGGGKVTVENSNYPLVVGNNSNVYFGDGVTFTGSVQFNGGNGNIYVGDTCLLGKDGLLATNGATTRVRFDENGNVNLVNGSLTLTGDCDILAGNDLTVSRNTTLDLAGSNLTCANVAAFGNVIDSSNGLGSVTVSEKLWFNSHDNSGYLPIYDNENGCYRLFETVLKNRGGRASGTTAVKFGFTIQFTNKDAYLLLAESVENGLLSTYVNWTGNDADKGIDYVFTAETIAEFSDGAYEQMANGKTAVSLAMTVTINGIDQLESGDEVTAIPTLETETGVVITGESKAYTIS